ncbi:MAG: hypothetical protein HOF74_12590 [Gammaproteobacteria bacterium]|jgi:hypothetical protein|nr:hypothetical protein [Gammaproteobacteria bacterium]MBT3860665.1 hypothetical protein [Gammaproteobacteria bacterium]MBT3988353.1 hypothetical protein [Gammaproteobacteria bacterium]MBT4581955.1 hypothetical protein [Gammaproteobacteria bacterium]MBT4659909.1 hypothetical protein [Gammaproteobacteria bacterium]
MTNSFPKSEDSNPAKNPDTQLNADPIYMEQDLWYFKTGKGVEVGPFRYRSEAQSNLDKFMKTLENRLDPGNTQK